MSTPIQSSPQTQQLLSVAGQAAADDAAAQAKVASDQQQIAALGQQISGAQATLTADQAAAHQADGASVAAYLAYCASLAADLGIPLPQTITPPPPPPPVASPTPVGSFVQRRI